MVLAVGAVAAVSGAGGIEVSVQLEAVVLAVGAVVQQYLGLGVRGFSTSWK